MAIWFCDHNTKPAGISHLRQDNGALLAVGLVGLQQLLERVVAHDVAVEHEDVICILEVVSGQSDGPRCAQRFCLSRAADLDVKFVLQLLESLCDFVRLIVDGKNDFFASDLG